MILVLNIGCVGLAIINLDEWKVVIEKTQIVMNNKEVDIAWALGKQCEWPTLCHDPYPHITVYIQRTCNGQTCLLSHHLCLVFYILDISDTCTQWHITILMWIIDHDVGMWC